VNWPTPTAFNRALTVALRPFNTWYTDRDFPALLARRGLRAERSGRRGRRSASPSRSCDGSGPW
jgi:hypothetical protein